MKTSWNKVANWYDKHLKEDKGNYHHTLVIPNLLKLINLYLPQKSAKILDLACGQGAVTQAIYRNSYKQIIGADISPELIAKAQDGSRQSGDKIVYTVENAAKLSLGFQEKHTGFDAITIVLAIQNIENLGALLEGCNKLLTEGGYLFIVMNHPMFRVPKLTSWGFEGNTEQYRKVTGYFSNSKFAIDMMPGQTAKTGNKEVTWSFHRSLQFYMKTLASKGFVLADLEEWVSNKVSEPGKRAEAENKARKEIPLFMALVARKRTLI